MSGTLTTDEVAELTGFSRWVIYDSAKAGGGLELPDGTTVRPIRCGRRLRWPAAPIRAALGLDQADTSADATRRPAGERLLLVTDSRAEAS